MLSQWVNASTMFTSAEPKKLLSQAFAAVSGVWTAWMCIIILSACCANGFAGTFPTSACRFVGLVAGCIPATLLLISLLLGSLLGLVEAWDHPISEGFIIFASAA